MKNWIRRKLRNFISGDEKQPCISVRESDSILDDAVLNFKVFNAIGGKVVEFQRYDRRNDRRDNTTYIITNDQDFGERIAKIAVMENIKI